MDKKYYIKEWMSMFLTEKSATVTLEVMFVSDIIALSGYTNQWLNIIRSAPSSQDKIILFLLFQ